MPERSSSQVCLTERRLSATLRLLLLSPSLPERRNTPLAAAEHRKYDAVKVSLAARTAQQLRLSGFARDKRPRLWRATERHGGDSVVRRFCCLLSVGVRVSWWLSPQSPGAPSKQKRELQARQTYCAAAADASTVRLTLVSSPPSFLLTSKQTQRVVAPRQRAYSFLEKPSAPGNTHTHTSPNFVPTDTAVHVICIVRSPASRRFLKVVRTVSALRRIQTRLAQVASWRGSSLFSPYKCVCRHCLGFWSSPACRPVKVPCDQHKCSLAILRGPFLLFTPQRQCGVGELLHLPVQLEPLDCFM